MVLAASNRTWFAIWFCLTIYCYGAHYIIVPSILKKIFGQKATRLYGIMLTYIGVSSAIMLILLQTPLVNHLIWYFELCAAFSAISLTLLHTQFNEAPFVLEDEKIILDSEVLKSE